MPGDAGYDDARRVWNGIIDRHPAVDRALLGRVRRRRGGALRPRAPDAGEHPRRRPPGRRQRRVRRRPGHRPLDDDRRPRRPRRPHRTGQAGARWADVDRATQLFGLATTGGEVSITGVAGLTLGGGMGLTQRAFGLACDNLRSIEIVTADGVVRTASRDEHPDLFWAARGGGQGLGVVTSFEFDLHPLGPDVAVAQVAYADDDAETCLRAWRDLALDAPDSVSPEAACGPSRRSGAARRAPRPPTCSSSALCTPATRPTPTTSSLPTGSSPSRCVDMSETMPYAALQAAFDAFFPDGGRYYFKSHFVDELTDDAIGALVREPTAAPTRSRSSSSGRWAVPSRGSRPTTAPTPTAGPASTSASTASGRTRPTTTAVIGWARRSVGRPAPVRQRRRLRQLRRLRGRVATSRHRRPSGRTWPASSGSGPSYDPDRLFAGAARRP